MAFGWQKNTSEFAPINMYNQTSGWVPVEIMSFYQALMWKNVIISLDSTIHSKSFLRPEPECEHAARHVASSGFCSSYESNFSFLCSVAFFATLPSLSLLSVAIKNSRAVQTEGEESVTSGMWCQLAADPIGFQTYSIVSSFPHDGFWKEHPLFL